MHKQLRLLLAAIIAALSVFVLEGTSRADFTTSAPGGSWAPKRFYHPADTATIYTYTSSYPDQGHDDAKNACLWNDANHSTDYLVARDITSNTDILSVWRDCIIFNAGFYGYETYQTNLSGVPIMVAGHDYVFQVWLNSTTLGRQSNSIHVTNAEVTTEFDLYGDWEDVEVSWTNMPSGTQQWVSIAPVGSAATTIPKWSYTGNSTNGSLDLDLSGLSGDYVARAFADNGYTIEWESAPFTVIQ